MIIKKKSCKAFFDIRVINEAKNQNARFGSDTEIELFLLSQNQLDDTLLENGSLSINVSAI